MSLKQFSEYTFTQKEIEYYTPEYIIEHVRSVLGKIDLDPASCEIANSVVKAETIYTKERDGLKQQWYGKVFLNPPYGKTGTHSNAGIWARKLIEEYESGNVQEAILLVNAALSYKWFQPLYKYLICFPYDRLDFTSNIDVKAKKHPQNNALVYIGKNTETFVSEFQEIGTIMQAVS